MIRHLNLDDPLDADVYIGIEDAGGSSHLESEGVEAEDEHSSSDLDEDDEEERPFSHRDALLACQQLSVYAFAQGQQTTAIVALMKHAREKLLAGMNQPTITSFFTTSDEIA
jgi:hypothetical protein